MTWLPEEMSNPRRLVFDFQPTREQNEMQVLLFRDNGKEPVTWAYDFPPTGKESDGVRFQKGKPEITVELDQPRGFAQVRLDAGKELYVKRRDLLTVQMEGVSGVSPVTIYEVNVEGATKSGG